MCYFHELAARNVATNCDTDDFNPVVNMLAYVALNRYRITDVSPDLTGLMGRNDAEMASGKTQQAYHATALPQDAATIEKNAEFAAIMLRGGIDKLVKQHDLTAELLNLPVDPAEHVKFGNRAVEAIFVKPGPVFGVRDEATEDAVYRPLQDAILTLISDPRMDAVARIGFHSTVGSLIVAAPGKVTPEQIAAFEQGQQKKDDFSCCATDATVQPASPPLTPMPSIKRPTA